MPGFLGGFGTVNGLGVLSQRNVYDVLGRLIMTVDALGGITWRKYDADSRLISLIDPVGNRTNWEYDRNGNVTKETDPLGYATTFAYDSANRLTGKTDRLGRRIDYGYYNNNQVQTETWKNSGGTTVNTITFTYNANGQVLTAGDSNGTVTFTYDNFGRLATKTDVWGIGMTFTYNKADYLVKVQDSKVFGDNYLSPFATIRNPYRGVGK